MFERQCGSCTKCCEWLYLVVDDELVHPGKPCKYLADGCTIHNKRPQVCKDFFCAYIQGLLPEWMKPDRCGVIVSVEKWKDDKLLLKAIQAGSQLTVQMLSWLIDFCRNNDVGLVYQIDGHYNYHGSDEFMSFMLDQHNQ